jgi:hypothetical protein
LQVCTISSLILICQREFYLQFLEAYTNLSMKVRSWMEKTKSEKSMDYGHTKAKSLNLCGPNSNPWIPNKYLGSGFKGLVFGRNNGWIMEKMDNGPKWVLTVWPKISQMPQNLSAQFVCPSPKVLDFNEKRLHWASVVHGRKSPYYSQIPRGWNVMPAPYSGKNLVTNFIQKRSGQALLFSFEYNLLPKSLTGIS